MSEQKFSGFVHLCHEGNLWASRGEEIFRSSNDGHTWHRVVKLPVSPSLWAKSRIRLTRRLFRLTIYHMRIVKKRYLSVIGFNRFFVFDLSQDCKLIAQGPLVGKRPLVFCKTRDERLLYGEYRNNLEKTPVSIWESSDGGCSWRSAFSFQGVRHIHGVFQDPYGDDMWITTGDKDHESAIWRASSDFSSIEKVMEGSQQTRAITLQFTKDKIFFGTDTASETNFLYGFSREKMIPEKLIAVDGAVFHSCKVGAKLFFSTACEPSVVNNGGYAKVYQVDELGECSLVGSWKKDFWHMKLFQYGQVFFADGQESGDGLWLTPFATQYDQNSQLIEINKGS